MCRTIFGIICSLTLLASCSSKSETEKESKTEPPSFCDCVNKDYHKEGDKEACEKIERDLEEKLKTASVEEKGEILIQIQDCKVQGQYDND